MELPQTVRRNLPLWLLAAAAGGILLVGVTGFATVIGGRGGDTRGVEEQMRARTGTEVRCEKKSDRVYECRDPDLLRSGGLGAPAILVTVDAGGDVLDAVIRR
jgi:hypothetical protein